MILKQNSLISKIIKKFGQEMAYTSRVPIREVLVNAGEIDNNFP